MNRQLGSLKPGDTVVLYKPLPELVQGQDNPDQVLTVAAVTPTTILLDNGEMFLTAMSAPHRLRF
ncbi:MAG: hypothetical protein IVW51_05380 [Thermaceae bacterium]|nr:hypothetical protein [Thermaceae bacterium]